MDGLKIALIGQLGVGKSHVASELVRSCDGSTISFAKEVYRVAEAVLGRKIDKSKSSDRSLLQEIGTTWGRNGAEVDPELSSRLDDVWPFQHGYLDIWVDAVKRTLADIPANKTVVLDDLRFPNELRFLLSEGFLVFSVQCSKNTRRVRLSKRGDRYALASDNHPSEAFPTWLSRVSDVHSEIPTIWNDSAKPDLSSSALVHVEELSTSLSDNRLWSKIASGNVAKWQSLLVRFDKET